MSHMHSTNTDSTILLVEDNEDLRENATLVLSLEGYQVFAACDGQEAATPTGQLTPVPPNPQYPPGFFARYCWW